MTAVHSVNQFVPKNLRIRKTAGRSAQKKLRTSRPGLAVGGKSRSENEGVICKVLGGQLLCAHHHFEWVNLNRRGGNTSLRVCDCPCDASHDQSGDAGCEQSSLVH